MSEQEPVAAARSADDAAGAGTEYEGDDVVEALTALLAEQPDAVVGAVGDDGIFVDMPASVPVDGHRVAVARSALDLVAPASRPATVSAWVEGKEHGRSEASVMLVGTPEIPATLHMFDVTRQHGVYTVVIVASEATDGRLSEVAEIAPPPPRTAHTRKDEVSTIIHADDAVTQMLGWSHQELVGQRSLDFVHPDDAERAIDLWMDCLSRPGTTFRARVRHKHRDGRWVWVELSNTNLLDDPDAGYVDCELFDVSEEMEAHEAVRASEQLLSRLTASLPVGVAQYDVTGTLLYANERLYEILGAKPDADEETLQSAAVDAAALDRALLAIHHGRDIDMHLLIDRRDDGERRECTLTIRSLSNDDGEVIGGVLVLEDVTEEARMRNELEHRATFDALTGCANRRTALNRLSEALTTARISRPCAGTAVVFVDLDDFKDVNDVYGHATGDAVLTSVGSRLRRVVRSQDLVGRIGGDEFLVVCPEVADEETALALAQRISAAMEAPMDVGPVKVSQTVSVGVAWTGSRPAVDADTLIAEADEAMYAAKKGRSNGNVVVTLNRHRDAHTSPLSDGSPAGSAPPTAVRRRRR